MTAAAGIWNNTAASANPLMSPKAMTSSSNNNDTDTSGATITANDFLTLLVTEMQNQDPTADTDPNEYIDQLVNVNSLEQLININQTLTAEFPTAASSNSDAQTSATGAAKAQQSSAQHHTAGAAHANATAAQSQQQATLGSAPETTYGNLGTQQARPAALRVARSLDGQRITR